MASAFIIRPFGIKQGIDFKRVERELIDPALSVHQLPGRTTADSLRQGNSRFEMFHRLPTADVVIADISIPNASVYYESGVRHALRPKRTFLIRGTSATLPTDNVPFDIRTDCYLTYDTENPATTLGLLGLGLRKTLLARKKDSPVFQLLPELPEQDRTRFTTEVLQETADTGPAKPMHTLLFTGHLLDSATRAKPRFPAAKEEVARQAIKEAVQVELSSIDGPVRGLSGGANGGDILFHEVCAELGVPTILYLPMPRDEYVRTSVQAGGPGWVARFDALYRRLPHRELSSSEELPPWLQLEKDYIIWERNNLWMLYNALALGSSHTTLLALWDGEPTSNGPGGTQDMVAQAKASGAKTVILPTKQLFNLG